MITTALKNRASALNETYRGFGTIDLLRAVIETEFPGRIALVSSFGAEAAVLLDLVRLVNPATPVLFIDTGKHFAETLDYRRTLERDLGLGDVRVVAPAAGDLAAHDPDGDLYRRDADACCHLRKVLPLERALSGFDAWITGRKRFHGADRGRLPLFETAGDRIKVNPLAGWTRDEIDGAFFFRELPRHPLVEHGYPSIGCATCTRAAACDGDPRAGRWAGTAKTECGIHRAA